jgi:hypothetical protein
VRNPPFSRCVLRVPSESDVHSEPSRDFIHHYVRHVLLPDDAFWAQDRASHFPTMHVTCLQGVYKPHHRSVHRRHRHQVEKDWGPSPRPHRGLHEATTAPGEAKSREVRFRGSEGHAPRLVMSECGIEANPEKISAIMDMGSIKNLKGVQRVTGCLAALSRSIVRLGERSLLLYKLMKKSDHFAWTPEAQEALDSLKNMLKSPLILTTPTLRSQCSYTSQRQPKWLVRCCWSSEKSPEGRRRCNGPCTSSARCSPTPKHATPRCRSLRTRS